MNAGKQTAVSRGYVPHFGTQPTTLQSFLLSTILIWSATRSVLHVQWVQEHLLTLNFTFTSEDVQPVAAACYLQCEWKKRNVMSNLQFGVSGCLPENEIWSVQRTPPSIMTGKSWKTKIQIQEEGMRHLTGFLWGTQQPEKLMCPGIKAHSDNASATLACASERGKWNRGERLRSEMRESLVGRDNHNVVKKIKEDIYLEEK